ncbi:MAG: ABC transporter permease [Anaerolineae bacterium]
MRAVFQKMWADIATRPFMSILIVVTLFASSALLTLALITLVNLSAPYDRSFEMLNGAHMWLFLDRRKVSRRDIERIGEMPGVATSTGLRYAVTTRVDLRDHHVWTSLRAIPESSPEVNRLFVQEGVRVRPGQRELLASKDLADLYDLSVGETITLTRADGKPVELPVVGLAYNPMWDTYRNSQPPYIYVTESTLRWLHPDESTWAWSIGLRLEDPEAVDAILDQIETQMRGEVVESYTDWRDVKQSAVFGARMNFIFLGAFGFFAILAAVLVIASSIGSIVLSQFRQIGILKTLGFTQRQVLWLYLGQYLLLNLIASPIGLIVGRVLSPLPLKSVAASLSTTFQPALDLPVVILVLGITSGVVTLAALGSARRGARTNIVRAIAVGAESPYRMSTWAARMMERLGLPIVVTLGVNDLFVKPLRSALTGFNLALGVVGIVFGLTLSTTLDTYRATPELLGIVYDAAVTREKTGESKTEYLLRKSPGVHAFYREYLVEVEAAAGKTFQVRAVDGDLDAFAFRISQGRFFQPNSYDAIAGRGLMDWLGLEVGDPLTVTIGDRAHRPVVWRIVGQYPEPVNAGQMMMVSAATIDRWVRQPSADTYFIKLSENCDTDALQAYLAERTGDDLNLTLVDQAIPDAVQYLQLAIYALSAILIGIALINVFNTTLLATREKVRDIGILKTVGMTPSQVTTIVYTTAGLLGLIATIIGVPAGFVFTRSLLANLSNVYGFGAVNVSLKVAYIALLVPLMLLVSVLGSLIPSRRAAMLSIVEVLRDE